MIVDFKHQQTAHCESGVVSGLLSHHGASISEPMAFGMGRGLFFGYFPFIKLNSLPFVTYRSAPGSILKNCIKAMGAETVMRSFRKPEESMSALEDLLRQNIPVGLQTGIFWLPYIPRAYRFHFNAHNLIVYGREGDEYLISDPVMPFVTRCSREDLLRARYARGPLAPGGKMYHLKVKNKGAAPEQNVRKAIRAVANSLTKVPFPLIGTRGVRFLADRLIRWPGKLGDERALLHLGQVIRMQEEIGTGGAGFRFLYAAFLQECAELLADSTYYDFSERLTAIGDRWRDFAVMAARLCKGRPGEEDTYGAMGLILRKCADMEKELMTDLSRHVSVSK